MALKHVAPMDLEYPRSVVSDARESTAAEMESARFEFRRSACRRNESPKRYHSPALPSVGHPVSFTPRVQPPPRFICPGFPLSNFPRKQFPPSLFQGALTRSGKNAYTHMSPGVLCPGGLLCFQDFHSITLTPLV